MKDNLAALLDKRIELQTLTETANDAGGFSSGWATSYTVWAGVHPLSGKEIYNADRLEDSLMAVFTIRYLDGLTPKMRVKMEDDYYNIRSIINPDFKNVTLEIMAEKVAL